MRKVLVVTNLSHASPRIPGLAKYLPEFGWEPIVLTGTPPEGTFGARFHFLQTPFPNVFHFWKTVLRLDPNAGFQKQIGIPFAVRQDPRSITNRLVSTAKVFLAYPDEHRNWKHFALDAATKFLETQKVHAIVSSSPPVTSHVVARALKRRHRLPWVADLRDLWSQNHNYHYGKLRQRCDRWLESRVLSNADALITVSGVWAHQLAQLHRRPYVHSITNGFDPDQLNAGPTPLTSEFTITYTGTIYEGKQDTGQFLTALQQLLSEGALRRRDVSVRFYGPPSERLALEISACRLADLVMQYGPVDRLSAFQKQRESQLLLMFYWNDPRIRGWYPLKTFEYLAARRPMLVLGTPGEDVVTKLLHDTQGGVYCRTLQEVKNALASTFLEYELTGKVGYNGRLDRIAKYSYQETARQLASVLDAATHTPHDPGKPNSGQQT